MNFAMKPSAALILALLLAACAGGGAVDDPVFKQGYEMGCAQAHSAREARAALTKDTPELFRRGFASGVAACSGEMGR